MKILVVELAVKFHSDMEHASDDGVWGRIVVDEALSPDAYARAIDLESNALLTDLGDYIRGHNLWNGVEGADEERIRLQGEMDGWREKLKREIRERFGELPGL